MGVSRADNSFKNWRNLPISNPKPDLHNINAHTKFGESPLMFTQVIIQNRKYGQITPSKIDEICPLAIPNQIFTISMHIPSLVKIHWCLLKLSSRNEKRTDGLTDDQHETIIPCHYCVAGYNNDEKSTRCIQPSWVWNEEKLIYLYHATWYWPIILFPDNTLSKYQWNFTKRYISFPLGSLGPLWYVWKWSLCLKMEFCMCICWRA